MTAFPLTINGRTYQESDFAPYGYAITFPELVADVAEVVGAAIPSAAAAAASASASEASRVSSASSAADAAASAEAAADAINSVIYGSGFPAASLGNEGQSYLDIATGLLYGPKALGRWPTNGYQTTPTPFSVAGLFGVSDQGAYYDFSDTSKVWADTGRTTPATVDGAIAGVTDKSGKGNHLSQSTAGARPTWRQRGGYKVARFGASVVASFLSSSAGFAANSDVTMAVTVRFEQSQGLGTAMFPFGANGSNTAICIDTGYKFALYNNAYLSSTTQPLDGQVYVLVMERTHAGAYRIWIDGVLVASGSTTDTQTSTAGICLGAFATSGALMFYGEIGQALAISRVLTDEERAKLCAHFAGLHGQASLGTAVTPLALLSDSGPLATVSGHKEHSPLARAVFETEATAIKIESYGTLFGLGGPGGLGFLPRLQLRVNGAWVADLAVGKDGTRTHVEDLGPGSKTVEIVASGQSKPSSAICGTWLQGVAFNGAATQVFPDQTAVKRFVCLTDSIGMGDGARETIGDGWILRARQAVPSDTVIAADGYGYNSLYDQAANPTLRSATVDRLLTYFNDLGPTDVVIDLGTNDYGLNKQTAANFETNLAALLDAIYLAMPTAQIHVRSALVRSSEVANSLGDTLGAYRTAASNACTGRGWVTFYDGSAILSTGDLRDGIHPTDAGHALVSAWFVSNVA